MRGSSQATAPMSIEETILLHDLNLSKDRRASSSSRDVDKKTSSVLHRKYDAIRSERFGPSCVVSQDKKKKKKKKEVVQDDRTHLRRESSSVAPSVLTRSRSLPKTRSVEEDISRVAKMDSGLLFSNVIGTIKSLKGLLLDSFETVRAKWEAATHIQARVRLFLAYRRYAGFRKALRRWRSRHARELLDCIRYIRRKNEDLSDRKAMFVAKKSYKYVRLVFLSWRRVTRLGRPRVRALLESVTDLMKQKNDTRLLRIMRKWRDVAVGPHSAKAVRARYRSRFEATRERILSQRLERSQRSIVTKNDVVREMRKEATSLIHSQRDQYRKLIMFKAWSRCCLKRYRWTRKKALRFRFLKLARRAFAAWCHLASRSAQGLPLQDSGAPVSEFSGGHCTKMIMHRWRRAKLRRCMYAWRKYARPRQIVRKRVLKFKTLRARRALLGWKAAAKSQKQIKRRAVDDWRTYSTLLMQVPFRAWFVWAHKRRQRKQTQRAVVHSFVRRRRYYRKLKIFKLWKHLSVYGKVEGLKSRAELIEALEKQNAFASALEQTVTCLETELLDAQKALRISQEQHKSVLGKVQEMGERIQERDFAIHLSEQEIAKMQASLDAARMIYPNTLNQLSGFSESPVGKKDGRNSDELKQLVRLRVKEKMRAGESESPRATSRRRTRRNSVHAIVRTRKMSVETSNAATAGEALVLSPTTRASPKSTVETCSPLSFPSPPSPLSRGVSNRRIATKGDHNSTDEANAEEGSEANSGVVSDGEKEFTDSDLMMLRRCKLTASRTGLFFNGKDESEANGGDVAIDHAAILKFILSGDVPEEEPFVNEDGSSFGDFVGSLALQYGMKHPLNCRTKDRIQARVATQRDRIHFRRNERERARANIYRSTEDKEGK